MTNITNNTFTGVQWDAKALESVQIVAQGLLNLTELFRSQNIEIGTMLSVKPDDKDDNLTEEEKEMLNIP